MLKSLFSRMTRQTEGQRTTLSARDHPICHEDISPGTLRVIEGLEDAGYEAYLVGGGVRDLLVGGHPKDFDIATDATPEEIKQVFRRARIIGRRFRIVHVRMGREVIEVTTFRGPHNPKKAKHATSSNEGMLLRDNVYGDMESDALRRDFTMNALYYSPSDEAIVDFTTGVRDIEDRAVKIIGDPQTRYAEDPVRMLRAVRLAAKLDFQIEPDTAEPIIELGHLLANIPPARLFDECLKLFMTGHAEATYQQLREYQLFEQLFPMTGELLANGDDYVDRLIRQAARNTDLRIQQQKRVTPAFIFAVILWPAVEYQRQQLLAEGTPPIPAMHQAAQWILQRQVQRVAIPRRFTMTIRDIWDLQPRLGRRTGKQAFKVFSHPKFRAAYDFMLLREEAGEDTGGLGAWWTEFQATDENGREAMVAKLGGSPKGRSKRRRPKRKKKPDAH